MSEKKRWIVALALAAAFVPGMAWAQAPAPAQTLTVEEDALAVLSDEPQVHMQSAARLYRKKDYPAAAREIRKARAFVDIEGGRGSEQSRAELRRSSAELETLASQVEQGKVKSAKDLEAVFARAEEALAGRHEEKARDSWAKEDARKTGEYLKTASEHLGNALDWVGEKAHTASSKAVAQSRTLGKKLAEGGTWVKSEVASGLESLGAEIEKLGQKLSAPRK